MSIADIRGSQRQGMVAKNGDTDVLNQLRSVIDGGMFGAKDALATRVFATESIDEASVLGLNQQFDTFKGLMTNLRNKLNIDARISEQRSASTENRIAALENAAIASAFAVKAGVGFTTRDMSSKGLKFASDEGPVFSITAENAPNYAGARSSRVVAAMEAFDQVQQRNAALYSMAYNYTVALQDEFCETIWPLYTLPADQIGFGIIVNRLTVHRGMRHTVDGQVQELKKIDLCRAGVDYTVLSRKKNRAVPVHRAGSADKFVDAADLVPWDYTEEGENFKTSALAFGKPVGYMGLCQTDAQLAAGSANQTDTLDPAISIEDVFFKVGDDILKVNIYGRQGANFVYSQQDRLEDRRLSFSSKYIVLSPATKAVDGSALTTLGVLATDNLHVVLDMELNGTANTEFSSIAVYGNRIGVVRVLDADQNPLPSSSPKFQDIATALSAAKFLGYTLRAFKTNLNLRERGDFVDRNQFTQLYEVPLLSPITYQRPVGQNGENDAADFETLVTATRFRMSGDAVTAILEAFERIREFTRVPFNHEDAPSGLGAARFHVKPYCADLTDDAASIDVASLVTSLDNKDAVENVQAALINKLRDVAFSMNILSEYPSAAKAMGMNPDSVVLVIATDPYIRRYLTVNGDLRPLTEKFNVKIVDTLDARFRGHIFMTFAVFDETRNQQPNILNWGNTVWAPEVVVSTNVSRGDSTTRETIVQPRYLFVNHLPVCAMIKVRNISKVFNETFLKVKQV